MVFASAAAAIFCRPPIMTAAIRTLAISCLDFMTCPWSEYGRCVVVADLRSLTYLITQLYMATQASRRGISKSSRDPLIYPPFVLSLSKRSLILQKNPSMDQPFPTVTSSGRTELIRVSLGVQV